MNIRKLAPFAFGALLMGWVPSAAVLAQDAPSQDASSEPAPRGEASEQRRRARPAPTPAQVLATAKPLLAAAGSTCEATQATLLGVTAEQQPAFEVSCANGPGELVVASTPPKVLSCLELAGQALTTRERDPAAEVGQQCASPENVDAVPYVTKWAAEAGITCTVDQASAIGKASGTGELIYEVGCADTDGYWINRAAGGAWEVTPCWDLAIDAQTCRFTTAAERQAGWRTVNASTEAAGCMVTDARRVGRDGQGLNVFEVKCAEGDGYLVRVGADRIAQRVSACAASAHIGGGCRLTTAAPAAAS